MSTGTRNWIKVASSSFIIGVSIAIGEKLIAKVVDSLLPNAEQIATYKRPGSLTIVSANGEIIQQTGPSTRRKARPGAIDFKIQEAFIAAEDHRFFEHNGVDLWGISRALLSNIRQRKIQEGGSTITQQLARIVFLSQERTLTRKLKEAALASKLERQFTKTEILEQYLNNVYLGSGAYGITDASWIYFSKAPNELKLEEIALIAGLPPAPSLYSPLVNPELALNRRSDVLVKMLEQGFISKKKFNDVISKPLIIKPSNPKYFDSKAPFFSSWVNQQLPMILTSEQLEIGGLEIRTSLNLNWQKKAQKVIQSVPNNLEAAIVSIEPKTGFVRVLVGGKDFKSNEYNRATQALRSPGSTFKIFPYAAAISEGFKPTDIFIDKPTCWNGYCPKNFGDRYLGEVSLETAFKQSLNTVSVQILDEVGFKNVISIANKLGVGKRQKLGKYYPLAIGAYEQTLIDMTGAYAGVTNRGEYIPPTPFEEIRGPKNTILWSRKENEREGVIALEKEVADILNLMLIEVVNSGTAKVAKLDNRDVAGKTGTSEGGRDLWFIGSTPDLSTGVWLGHDDNRKTNMESGEAAWTWKKFILEIEDELETLEFSKVNDL